MDLVPASPIPAVSHPVLINTTGVAVDQQGFGTLSSNSSALAAAADTNFFQVDGIGRTFGLLQASTASPTPTRNGRSASIATSPSTRRRHEIVISSGPATSSRPRTRADLVRHRDPASFGSSERLALAYGAPAPAPRRYRQPRQLHLCRHRAGQIYVTTAPAAAAGISTGPGWLADPADRHRPAAAATRPTPSPRGVYDIANSSPRRAPTTWVNITGDLLILP